jgi:hypothetical protein
MVARAGVARAWPPWLTVADGPVAAPGRPQRPAGAAGIHAWPDLSWTRVRGALHSGQATLRGHLPLAVSTMVRYLLAGMDVCSCR